MHCIDDGAGGCVLFVPPVENFFGWFDPSNGYAMSVDYAGLVPGDFGTEFSGTVTERPLPDGRAEVHIRLHTKNALAWVAADFDFNGDLLFGTRWDGDGNVAGEPTLGDSFLEVVLINPAPDAPLPDLTELFDAVPDDWELKRIGFNANVKGPLRAAFGVPDGTPGRAKVVQKGLFMASFKGAVADGFPVEKIKLQVIGK
jgi:hypothetical protein